jgi:methylated-DNA-[protein]-cysteine S-methyltransferase
VTALGTWRSPLGPVAVEATDRGVCGVFFGATGRARPPVSAAAKEHVARGLAALQAYFRGEPPELPELDLAGSDFDLRVWRALLGLPFGETRTYGELARELGEPGAARAVGAAAGRNPVPVLVPCHRIVAAGGRLGGYGLGEKMKRWLLAHEAAHAPALRPG